MVEGNLMSWNMPAHSMVLADATENFSFKDSGWNECCVSSNLPGVLRPSGTHGAEEKG